MADIRTPLDPIFKLALGVSATVTVPGGGPVTTDVVVNERSEQLSAVPSGVSVLESVTQISLRRAAVPSVPARTRIVVAGTTYFVDSVVHQDDEIIVVTAGRS